MREVKLEARLLEQLGQPLPTVGRLDRDLGLAVDPPKQLEKRGRVVFDPAREDLPPLLVDDRDVRAALVQVDADRIHPWASSDPGTVCARGHSAPGTGSLGGPLLHGIKWPALMALGVGGCWGRLLVGAWALCWALPV